jgi:hypothetical protein
MQGITQNCGIETDAHRAPARRLARQLRCTRLGGDLDASARPIPDAAHNFVKNVFVPHDCPPTGKRVFPVELVDRAKTARGRDNRQSSLFEGFLHLPHVARVGDQDDFSNRFLPQDLGRVPRVLGRRTGAIFDDQRRFGHTVTQHEIAPDIRIRSPRIATWKTS